MDIIKKLAQQFSKEFDLIKYEENFYSVRASLYLNNPKSTLNINELDEKINYIINNNDIVRIYIFEEYEDGDEYELIKLSDNKQEFLQYIKNDYEPEDDIRYRLDIEIDKDEQSKEISIYNFEEFILYMYNLSLESMLTNMNKIINEFGYRIFSIKDELNININTKSLYFISDNLEYEDINREYIVKYREDYINRRNSICNNRSNNKINLIPEDFCYSVVLQKQKLQELLDATKNILSIISISESIYIDKNIVHISFNGYKEIDSKIEYSINPISKLNQYYLIGEWVYGERDLNDKVGIARNVISISIKENDMINIEDGLYESILSSHRIYLKKNLEKYLEVKEKIGESILDMSQKFSDTANNVGKDLRNNVISMIAFFITVILTNKVSGSTLQSIFTKDIVIISMLFIAGSIIFMIFSLVEANLDKIRFEQQYFRLKDSYKDILNPTDIDNIFKSNAYLEEDKRYINKKIICYLVFWIIFLFIITAGVISLSSYEIDLKNLIILIKEFKIVKL